MPLREWSGLVSVLNPDVFLYLIFSCSSVVTVWAECHWYRSGWQTPSPVFIFQLQLWVLTSAVELQSFPALFHLTATWKQCVWSRMWYKGSLRDGERRMPWEQSHSVRGNGWLYGYHSSFPFPVLSHQTEIQTSQNTRAVAATLRAKKPNFESTSKKLAIAYRGMNAREQWNPCSSLFELSMLTSAGELIMETCNP